jgi:ubiquitin-conjugating enzyme E2 variant
MNDASERRGQREGKAAPSHNYSPVFRVLELIAITSAILLILALAARLFPTLVDRPLTMIAAAILSLAAADIGSGIAHWAGDTWGSEQWPLIGQTVIRTFREHHVDQLAITRHDAVEVNATSAMLALPLLGIGHWIIGTHPFVATVLLWTSIGGIMTNQIHSWSHRAHNPWWIRALQRSRIVLSPEAHSLHHDKPYADHYCITTGWLNGFFAATKFWRGMEWIITKLTGAVAREEDLKLAAREAAAASTSAATSADSSEPDVGAHEHRLATPAQ